MLDIHGAPELDHAAGCSKEYHIRCTVNPAAGRKGGREVRESHVLGPRYAFFYTLRHTRPHPFLAAGRLLSVAMSNAASMLTALLHGEFSVFYILTSFSRAQRPALASSIASTCAAHALCIYLVVPYSSLPNNLYSTTASWENPQLCVGAISTKPSRKLARARLQYQKPDIMADWAAGVANSCT